MKEERQADPSGEHKVHGLNWHVRQPKQGPKSLAMKNHFIAMMGEYVGTTLFLIFALGGANVANLGATSVTGNTAEGHNGSSVGTANTSSLLFIALSFGFSLAVNVWIFFRVSGGLFNPAISFGMVLVGALKPLRGALLVFVQILGGITGSAIVNALTPGNLNVRTTLSPGTSVVRGLFIEVFLTAFLMLSIFLLAAEKHKATFIAPVGIGLALFVAELFGVYWTGGSLNPARSFGPSVVQRKFNGYDWIYWVGPGVGSILAAGFYKLLKFLQYETVLGPESDGTKLTPTISGATAVDEERNIESGNVDIQGPGLGDLLTRGESIPSTHTSPVESRLIAIESMLANLSAKTGHAQAPMAQEPVATVNVNHTRLGQTYQPTSDASGELSERAIPA